MTTPKSPTIKRWISPNEVYQAALETMLAGSSPASREDWILLANFWAHSISAQVQPEAIQLMAMLYRCPLTKREVMSISAYQCARKGAH